MDLAALLTAGVGLSRIYRGDHHPTDAIAGLVLGAGALWVAVLAVRAWAARAGRGSPNRSGIGDHGDSRTATGVA